MIEIEVGRGRPVDRIEGGNKRKKEWMDVKGSKEGFSFLENPR